MRLIVIYKEVTILLTWVKQMNFDHYVIDTFCDFFQQHGRFPGSQDFIVVLKPEIPYFIKINKVISTNQMYEKCSRTDARRLVSIQALAALNIYYGGST